MSAETITMIEALEISLLGLGLVFSLLLGLTALFSLLTWVTQGMGQGRATNQAVASTEQPMVPEALAPGSCGDLRLQGVSEREAAMLMAIVADSLDKPLNTLRFRSIRLAEEKGDLT